MMSLMKHLFRVRSLLHVTIALTFFVALRCASPSSDKSPDNQSNWIKLGPGGGGATFIPTFAHGNPNQFVVRCDMTGTYITSDGGDSYSQTNFPNGATAYAYDPSDERILYAGNNALHRSTDGGKTWQQLFPHPSEVKETKYSGDHASFRITTKGGSLYPEENAHVHHIRVDASDTRTIYFSMGRYLFRSTDGGEHWNRYETDAMIVGLYTNATSAKDILYILTARALNKFNKETAEITTQALPEEMVPVISLTAGTKANSDAIIFYALHNADDDNPDDEFGETQLWISRDAGATWNRSLDKVLTNDGNTPSYSMVACAEKDAGTAYLVCNRYKETLNDGTTRYWYGALKSSNEGESWEWVWKGGGGSGRYGVKDGQGVANLTDAWTEKAFGGEYIRLIDAGVYPDDGNVAIVTDWYRTMKTTDGGKTWREIYSVAHPDGSFTSRGLDVTTTYGVHFDPFDPQHIAISYTDIGYHHSFNGGKSWIRSAEGVPSEWVNTCYWVAFDPEVKGKLWSVWSSLHDFPRGKMTRNPNWKKYGKGGVCVSTDGGKTWQPTVEGMGFDSPATSIVVDPKSPPGQRTLYASVYSKGVFKSTDDGKTWTLKNNGIGPNTAAFELTLSPNGDLFLTISATPAHTDGKAGLDFSSGAVYRSKDGAETWTKLNVNDGLLFPNGIEVDPKDPNRVFLGCWSDITLSDLVGGAVVRRFNAENKTLDMPGGIFLSEDGGDTWQSIFDPEQYVYDVTIDPRHPGRVYCNTFNGVAWRSDDNGKTWNQLAGYNFHWGHRVVVDIHDEEKVYLTTFGSSLLHGTPKIVANQ
jgi:photosystem II stability/assembly factor-like uncharacterized protein